MAAVAENGFGHERSGAVCRCGGGDTLGLSDAGSGADALAQAAGACLRAAMYRHRAATPHCGGIVSGGRRRGFGHGQRCGCRV